MVRVSRFSLLLAVFSFLTAFTALYAQGGADDVKHKFAPINTAIPSLSIAPDARGGAMGDNGVATTPDVNSQYWNPAKYAFSYSKAGVALSYTPWLRKLVNDVALAYLAGYYKYKAGDKFTEEGKPVDGKRDICDIYAIMYETSESVPTLDGTNAFTSPNLISMARIDDAKETDEWTYFKLPFNMLTGKYIDKEKLLEGKYNVAIVFTSSLEGDHFNGAIGSTLLIDEVELIYRSEN